MLTRAHRLRPVFRLPNHPVWVIRHTVDGLRPCQPQQPSPHHEEIRQRTRHEQPIGIFEKSTIARLHEVEDSLDDKKGMFAFGAHSRFGGVLRFLFAGERMVTRAFLVREVLSLGRVLVDHRRLSGIGAIAPYPGLGAMQQIGQDRRVVDVGGCCHRRVNELGFAVDAKMRLHPKIPLISLLRLMHRGIARLPLILRRGGGADDGGIDNGTAREGQPRGSEMGIDQREDLFAHAVRFEQVAEFAHGRLVGRPFAPEIDADKSAHGARVVKRFFHRRVREVEPLLQAVDAQHPFQAHRRTPGAVVLWIKRFDQRAQLAPWHHLIHLAQELVAPGRFVVLLEPGFGEGRLLRAH